MTTGKRTPPQPKFKYSQFKAQFKNHTISELKKEVDRLTAENEQMKNDPEGLIGKFLKDYNEAIMQNNRLSATLCGYMKENSGSITVKKETFDSFTNHRLIINVVPSEGDVDYTFSFVAEPNKTPESDNPQA
jgi:hypothetical protein